MQGESTTSEKAAPPVARTRHALSALARAAAPGYGWCLRCGMPWKFTEGHVTEYGKGRGCFPLCEECWGALTVEQRVPFYDQLIRLWDRDKAVEGGEAEAILGAVMAGG